MIFNLLALLSTTSILTTSLSLELLTDCHCSKNKTLHQHFCDDEFIVTVILLESILEEQNLMKHNSFVLIKHKENDLIQAHDYLSLYTNTENGTCDLQLTKFHIYILGGNFKDGKHWVSLCNLVLEGYDLPCSKEDYSYCGCEIIYDKCTTDKCPSQEDSCTYIPLEGSNGWGNACLRDNTGHCNWKHCDLV